MKPKFVKEFAIVVELRLHTINIDTVLMQQLVYMQHTYIHTNSAVKHEIPSVYAV